MNLDYYAWFLETNEEKGGSFEGVKLLTRSNSSISVFVTKFDNIILSESRQIELDNYRFEADNICKHHDGYVLQIFFYKNGKIPN